MDMSHSVKDLPESLTTLMECPTPISKPACPLYLTFGLIAEHEIPITTSKDDFAWLLASTLNTTEYSSDGTSDKSDDNQRAQVPVWSGYNSLVNKVSPHLHYFQPRHTGP